jgi:energy-coupling factor transporter ATP-binding protein EcfA2
MREPLTGTASPAEDGELRARLAVLRARLREDLERVTGLRAVAERRVVLDGLVADLERQLARIQRAAVITLIGATGAGKSTLLNALAGSRIAEEGIDRPTTRRPVIYAPADADLGELTGRAVAAPEGWESEGAPVVVRHDAFGGPWGTQILIDAPDLNSIDEQHRARVTALAERSDVLVVVLHHQSVVEAASVSFVDAFTGRRHLVFVLNRSDELSPQARDALLDQVRSLAATRWQAPEAPVVALSARAAQAEPRAEGWSELCRALHGLVRESAIGGVRRLNAVGTAGRIQAIFAAVRAEVDADLGALPEEVGRGSETLAERLADEVATRLRLRHADLRALLLAEAAKRWEGPGGWALRAGGLTSLGLAAGAALATRSPVIAAGTAAGAAAADQLRRVLRDERLADASALMPAGAELPAWYREALSPARVRAARLTGAAEGLGVPSAERTRLEAAEVVEEAWSRLVHRDLPAAAERSVPGFIRLLLDLPVYGLAAWVVYQSARGFLAASYVGVDFLLNAALLLGAYLFGVRLAVARGLGLRAARLCREAIGRVREALAAQATLAEEASRSAATEQSQALTRLANLEETWRAELRTS